MLLPSGHAGELIFYLIWLLAIIIVLSKNSKKPLSKEAIDVSETPQCMSKSKDTSTASMMLKTTRAVPIKQLFRVCHI